MVPPVVACQAVKNKFIWRSCELGKVTGVTPEGSPMKLHHIDSDVSLCILFTVYCLLFTVRIQFRAAHICLSVTRRSPVARRNKLVAPGFVLEDAILRTLKALQLPFL